MDDIVEIVTFYKDIKDRIIFSGNVISGKELSQAREMLNKKNSEFFNYLEEKTLYSELNYRSIQIIYNKLFDVYTNLVSDFYDDLIPKVENTPLFRYDIQYKPQYLLQCLSAKLILNSLVKVHRYLEDTFPNDLKSENYKVLHDLNYTPAYTNSEGYYWHIYTKLSDPRALQDDFYGNRKLMLDKIDIFLSMKLPKCCKRSLPLGFGEYPPIDSVNDTLKSLENKSIKDLSHQMDDKPDKKVKYVIQIKNMPKDKNEKEELYLKLKDIYNYIKPHNIPTSSWSDFKLIFNETGSNTKIQWAGDAKVLNFVFRKLGNTIKYSPDKWEAISYYFNPKGEKEKQPKKLQWNSHHEDESLEKLIDDFISSLTS